ncbi:MAG: ion transporter [Candidatus Anammoxibacter sp.]
MKSIFIKDKVIFSVIAANSVVIFLLSFNSYEGIKYLAYLDMVFTLFFLVELGCKIGDAGFKGYISSGWNKFDFMIIILSIPSLLDPFFDVPDISFLLILRLARFFRFFRLLKFIPDIDGVIQGLNRAVRAAVGILLALLLYNFLFAILSCHLFGNTSPEHFGNPFTAMYSTFKVFSTEGWYEIPDSLVIGSTVVTAFFIKAYFMFIVLSGGIIGISLANAVLVDQMTLDNNANLEKKVDELNRKIDRLISNEKFKR